jgi:hypothetical protein
MQTRFPSSSHPRHAAVDPFDAAGEREEDEERPPPTPPPPGPPCSPRTVSVRRRCLRVRDGDGRRWVSSIAGWRMLPSRSVRSRRQEQFHSGPVQSSGEDRSKQNRTGRSSRRRRSAIAIDRSVHLAAMDGPWPFLPRVLISFGSCTCGQIWLGNPVDREKLLLLPCSDRDGSSGVSVEAALVSLAAATSNHSNQFHNLLLDPTG